ncbi:MAG: RNA export factor, cytoplasmic nucleoporin Gle1 [Amphiamblys sp. WSBS2006]|nr:MAG: RNA export factor, cytoplasmic nucleoporin Gle1 [Amphiamblys sp. WSBS2006]
MERTDNTKQRQNTFGLTEEDVLVDDTTVFPEKEERIHRKVDQSELVSLNTVISSKRLEHVASRTEQTETARPRVFAELDVLSQQKREALEKEIQALSLLAIEEIEWEERSDRLYEETRKLLEQQKRTATANTSKDLPVPEKQPKPVEEPKEIGQKTKTAEEPKEAGQKTKTTEEPKEVEQKIKAVRQDHEALQEEHAKTTKENDEKQKELKRKINTRVGQIAPSLKQIEFVTNDLVKLMEDNTVHRKWIFVTTARIVIKQAEKLVSAHLNSAYAIGDVCVRVGEKFAGFIDVLVLEMNAQCCYTIPVYPAKGEHETEALWKEKMQYRRKGSMFESEDEHKTRMVGMISLYAAMIQTDRPKNPHAIDNGWRWISRTLNTSTSDMSSVVVSYFLEICGYGMYIKYGPQFIKILKVIQAEYLPRLPVSSVSSKTRLEIYLETVLAEGKVKEPKERRFLL